MKLAPLTIADYEAYLAAHYPVSFLQSPQIAERRQHDGWESERIGLFDGKRLVGATTLYRKPLFGRYSRYEVLQGPIIDYENPSVLEVFICELKKWVKSRGGVELRVAPPVSLRHRDNSGAILDDGYSAQPVLDVFAQAGCRLMPYAVSDFRADVFRWTFIKDMREIDSEQELLRTCSSSTKRSIKRAQQSGITIRELAADELPIFHDLIATTGERWNFTARSMDYYNELLTSFGPERLKVFAAEISRDNYKKYVSDLVEKQQKIIGETADRRVREKAEADKAHYQHILAHLPETDPIVLAGTVVINYGGEVTHLFSGSYKEHAFLRATHLLRYHALQFALSAGVEQFNFYGTKGNHSGHPEEEGIFQFKRGFGGSVEEQVGVFTYTPRPIMRLATKVVGRLRRAR